MNYTEAIPPANVDSTDARRCVVHVEGIELTLTHTLGSGGFGKVYGGSTNVEGLEGPLALKIQSLGNDPTPEDRKNILSEYSIMRRLEVSQNIAKVLRYGIEKNPDGSETAFGLMPEYKGTLDAWLALGQGRDIAESVGMLAQAARATEDTHTVGIVHRDIKPGNLLIDKAPQRLRNAGINKEKVLLSDFGLAVSANPRLQPNRGKTPYGTPEYMPPEQWRAEVNKASDVYALGVVAYKMLTGSVPFSANTPMGVAQLHLFEQVPTFEMATGTRNTPLKDALEPVVKSALEKDELRRPVSAEALACDLEDAAYKVIRNESPEQGKLSFPAAWKREQARAEIANGNSIAQSDKPEAALTYYDRAIAYDPKSMIARFEKGRFLLSQRRVKEANHILATAYNCPLRDKADYITRGLIMSHFGDQKRAFLNYKNAHERGYTDKMTYAYGFKSLYTMAKAEYIRGNFKAAVELNKGAAELSKWVKEAEVLDQETVKVPAIQRAKHMQRCYVSSRERVPA